MTNRAFQEAKRRHQCGGTEARSAPGPVFCAVLVGQLGEAFAIANLGDPARMQLPPMRCGTRSGAFQSSGRDRTPKTRLPNLFSHVSSVFPASSFPVAIFLTLVCLGLLRPFSIAFTFHPSPFTTVVSCSTRFFLCSTELLATNNATTSLITQQHTNLQT
jgi:hypothetical protein